MPTKKCLIGQIAPVVWLNKRLCSIVRDIGLSCFCLIEIENFYYFVLNYNQTARWNRNENFGQLILNVRNWRDWIASEIGGIWKKSIA